jgi:hypothetical protein
VRGTRGGITRRLAAVTALAGLAAVVGLGAADAGTVEGPATVTREAYFTNPLTQATPPVLRNGFPPATACLVAGLLGVPQVCGTEVQQLGSLLGLSDGLPILITPDGDLAQPVVLPGTTPVGMIAGQQRYASLVALGLPTVPAGEQIGTFDLVLHQDGLNFAIESPATRDLVLQIVGQLEVQDPQKVADAVTRALSGEVPIVTDTVTGIEACPITEAWQAGPAQGASLDGIRIPAVDCQIGTTGVYDAAAKTWTFDLSFAAQAWTVGTDGKKLDNQGVLLRPVGAPNLAYGDPDLSTNWLVSLATSTAAEGLRPAVRYTTAPAADAGGTGGVDLGGTTGSVDLPTFDSGPPLDLGAIGSTPPQASTLGAIRAGYAARHHTGGKGHTPGWVWLALPLGLLGAVVFGQSLVAAPASHRRRPGALTRLTDPSHPRR